MRLEYPDGLIQDGRITGANLRLVEIEVHATEYQLLMLRGRWRRRRRRWWWRRWRRWWRKGDQWIAQLVTDHCAEDSADDRATGGGRGDFGSIRMRLVAKSDSKSGAGSSSGSYYTADQATSVPSPRRWSISGASGDRGGDAQGDAGCKSAVSGRSRWSRFH